MEQGVDHARGAVLSGGPVRHRHRRRRQPDLRDARLDRRRRGRWGRGGIACPDPIPGLPNANTACDPSTGVIYIVSCNVGFHNVNGNPTNGCEYGPILYTGPEVCDGLDNDADGVVDEEFVFTAVPNGTTSCINGAIVLVCNDGLADQNAVLTDGCEVMV